MTMGLFRQEYWTGWPFLTPQDLPDPGIKPALPALAGKFFTTDPLGKPSRKVCLYKIPNMSSFSCVWLLLVKAVFKILILIEILGIRYFR